MRPRASGSSYAEVVRSCPQSVAPSAPTKPAPIAESRRRDLLRGPCRPVAGRFVVALPASRRVRRVVDERRDRVSVRRLCEQRAELLVERGLDRSAAPSTTSPAGSATASRRRRRRGPDVGRVAHRPRRRRSSRRGVSMYSRVTPPQIPIVSGAACEWSLVTTTWSAGTPGRLRDPLSHGRRCRSRPARACRRRRGRPRWSSRAGPRSRRPP